MMLDWEACFEECPLVAILRGIRPEEVVETVGELVTAGITLIEVPLNSPSALASISLAADAFQHRAFLGAGTVLTAAQVRAVQEAGSRFIVAPNFSPAVAKAAVETGLVYFPGVCTPSEAFTALEAGANVLKLFPAEMMPSSVIKALRAVIPHEVKLLPVGGVNIRNMADYIAAGATGFGIGSGLYVPGATPRETGRKARAFIETFHSLAGHSPSTGK